MKNFQERLQELKSDVEDLWGRAYRESLTRLLNRSALEDVLLTQLNALDANPSRKFALLYMDLNGFKAVNDTLGHSAGDLLLVQVAQRLQRLHLDRSFRDGGDEFAVVLNDCPDRETALQVAESIRSELAKPYDLEGKPANVAASIGVVFCDARSRFPSASSADDFKPVRAIRDEGDAAMYWAKRLSKTSLRMFAPNTPRPLNGGCRLSSEPTPPNFQFPVYKKILREGYGKGRIVRTDEIKTCDFRVLQYSDGGIELFAEYPPTPQLTIRTTGGPDVSFEGVAPEIGTHNVCEIASQSLVYVGAKASFSSETGGLRSESFISSDLKLRFKNALVSSIRFYLTNLQFPKTSLKDEDFFCIHVEEYLFTIHRYGDSDQHRQTVDRLKETKETEVTCYAEVSIASSADVDKAVSCLDRILDLLTLFQGTRISWLSCDYLAENGDLIQSICRHSVSGALNNISSRGIWTIPFLQAKIPSMYVRFSEIAGEWNLTNVMGFFAQCSLPGEILEAQAGKIIQCIELLVHAYTEQFKENEERENSLDCEEFAHALKEMCNHLEIAGLMDSPSRLMEAVNLVSVFRLRLRRKATLVGPSFNEYPSDSEPSTRNYERWRRVEFLKEFASVCIEAILDPDYKHQIGTGGMNDVYDDLGIVLAAA